MKILLSGLVKIYNRHPVVDGVSIELKKGEVVGLLGPNGAGKTTTFYMTVGLIQPNAGKVFLDSTEITRWSMYRRAQAGIGYLAQENSVFRKLSVRDNLCLLWEMKGYSKKDQEKMLEKSLSEFNLTHLIDRMAYQLSGGERRRVEIARSLALSPDFLLLDEPFTGVDPISVAEIQELVLELTKKDIGILITDHNVRETLAITDRAYIIREGKILASGTPQEITENELARKFYLGEKLSIELENSIK
ncbi:MAG: LPS export ABC transporter ATP-binding protein [Chloroflexi bacterium]|nr:LPS export ABC transporter ATP-binding protein [Chloroflexota bacterium]